MDKDTYDKLLKKMVISYNLYKKQAYVDRLMKEGELQGYNKILSVYNSNTVEEFQEEINALKVILKGRINQTKDQIKVLKAKEELMSKMDLDLEENLSSLDILNQLEENKDKYPKDVQVRVDNNLCALKRPGKGGFVCDKPVVKGSKYCKEHLEQFDKLLYADLFPKATRKKD